MPHHRISLEYFVHNDRVYVEIWDGAIRPARLLSEYYKDPQGRALIDADIRAWKEAGHCKCGLDPEKDFDSPREWFECVIRNNFAEYNGVADSSHRGNLVTHIPESQCRKNK